MMSSLQPQQPAAFPSVVELTTAAPKTQPLSSYAPIESHEALRRAQLEDSLRQVEAFRLHLTAQLAQIPPTPATQPLASATDWGASLQHPLAQWPSAQALSLTFTPLTAALVPASPLAFTPLTAAAPAPGSQAVGQSFSQAHAAPLPLSHSTPSPTASDAEEPDPCPQPREVSEPRPPLEVPAVSEKASIQEKLAAFSLLRKRRSLPERLQHIPIRELHVAIAELPLSERRLISDIRRHFKRANYDRKYEDGRTLRRAAFSAKKSGSRQSTPVVAS
eukprot:m.266153 g.266153  ORF g.266153 m.266153 type:complete len:276 (+) comp54695_c0_seq4:281-1108(+)